jgi:hypothetical protein
MDKRRPEIEMARLNLSAFVRSEASLTADELGFGWRPAEIVPHGLAGLQAELRACHQTGLPFRVLGNFSDDTIFVDRESNWAMRFWHDTRHVWLSTEFTTEDELEVASCHLARAKADGLGPGTLEYALLLADTVGQTLYVKRAHRFVEFQLEFALDVVDCGIEEAIQREISRSSVGGTAA